MPINFSLRRMIRPCFYFTGENVMFIIPFSSGLYTKQFMMQRPQRRPVARQFRVRTSAFFSMCRLSLRFNHLMVQWSKKRSANPEVYSQVQTEAKTMKQIFLVRISIRSFAFRLSVCHIGVRSDAGLYSRGKSGVDFFVFDRSIVREIMVQWSWQLPDNQRDHGSNPGCADMKKMQ